MKSAGNGITIVEAEAARWFGPLLVGMGVYLFARVAGAAFLAPPRLVFDTGGIDYRGYATRRNWSWGDVGEASVLRLSRRNLADMFDTSRRARQARCVVAIAKPNGPPENLRYSLHGVLLSYRGSRFPAFAFVDGEAGAQHLADRINRLRDRFAGAA